MKELYQKIQNYFQYDKADSVFISIVKSLVLLFCGGYFGKILREIDANPSTLEINHILILLLGISTFIYLEVRRIIKEKNFPVTILDHLKATEELKVLNEKFSRITKIYNFIEESIRSLNSNTCPIVNTPENTLCHQDLKGGLEEVLYDIIDQTNYFFKIDNAKFIIGIYIKKVYDSNSEKGDLKYQERTFILKDDFHIEHLFPQSLAITDDIEQIVFQTQTAILESLKFQTYISKPFEINNYNYNTVCSPIPNVCEDCPPDGVVFSLYNSRDLVSTDCENILQIYGRILSNWITKYNDCVAVEKELKPDLQHIHNVEKLEPTRSLIIKNPTDN